MFSIEKWDNFVLKLWHQISQYESLNLISKSPWSASNKDGSTFLDKLILLKLISDECTPTFDKMGSCFF